MTDQDPHSLRAAGRHNPICTGTRTPTLRWASPAKGQPDSYEIRASNNCAALTEGHEPRWAVSVDAAGTCTMEWPGTPLKDGEIVYWRVGARTSDHIHWSEIASVEADPGQDWPAAAITHPDWVTPSNQSTPLPQFHNRIRIPGDISSARLYISTPGVAQITLDGAPLITGELEPGYSNPAGPILASGWDITGELTPGDHELLLAVGGGMTFVPELPDRYSKFHHVGAPLWIRCAVKLTDSAGCIQWIGTDETWQTRLGPTTSAHWYGGEDHHEGGEFVWQPAVTIADDPVRTRWRDAPPIEEQQLLDPVKVIRRTDGSRTVDFGVNVAGQLVLHLAHATPGDLIQCWPSEILNDEGQIDQRTTGSPIYDTFIPASAATDWHPAFVYHGARYWHITGLDDAELDVATQFRVLHASNPIVGVFSSSDSFLNTLHDIVQRAVRGNMYSVFTDCPHREKLGWLEQLHYCFETITRTHDAQAHLVDMVRHITESATPDGLVPSISPEYVVFNYDAHNGDNTAFRDDINWGRTIIELPWKLYRFYGDQSVLRLAFPTITRYLHYIEGRSTEGLLDFGLGDWIQIDPTTPRSLVADTGWVIALRHAALIARVLGEDQRAAQWEARATVLLEATTAKHRTTDGTWGTGSQGSWAAAWELLEHGSAERENVIVALLRQIEADNAQITVGENTLSALIAALTDSGNADLLLRMIRRTDAAGYGHQISQSATALTESWRGTSGESGVASQNHFMLGVIDGWLHEHVAGLRQDPDDIGWQHVIIDPLPLADVTSAASTLEAPSGRITVNWTKTDGGINIDWSAPDSVRVDIASHR